MRCPSRMRVEFDHVTPVASGGESTVANLRLCCRAHNQYRADRAFGVEFMKGKREAAAQPASGPAMSAPCACAASSAPSAPAPGQADLAARRAELTPWLRKLGLRVDEAKRGAALCDALAGDTLERRVKFALSGLARERFRLAPRAPLSDSSS